MPRKKKLETALENLLTPPSENSKAVDHELLRADELPDSSVVVTVVGTPAPADESALAAASEPPEEHALSEAPPTDAGVEVAPPSSVSSPSPESLRKPAPPEDWADVDAVDVMPEEEETAAEVDEEGEEEFVFAEETPAEVEVEVAGTERQLVIFMLADEWYGVNIGAVEQIIELQRITPVPHTPPYIAGLTNLRGAVLPVVDLRRRLGLPTREPTRETRIVVAQVHRMQVGMIVDAVTEVRHVAERDIEPPSPLVTPVDAMYMTGIAKVADPGGERNAERLIVLLDLEQILPGVRGH